MSAWFLLDERVMGTTVTNHDDGHSSQANVHHQVLVVAWFGADLGGVQQDWF